jgi:DHA2 family multidrug resistance protein-like MFS transporter
MGVGLAAVFVTRQRKLEHPLIDLELFKFPAFSTSVVTQLVATITLGGIYFLISQYLQLVLGLSPLHAGLALLPTTVTGIIGSMLAPVLVRHFQHRTLIAGGMLLTAAGMIAIAVMHPSSGLTILVSAYVVMSFGINVAITLTTDNIMSVAPPERAGAASAISETSAELGLALGVAILGSIATASYRHIVADNVPAGIREDLVTTARATLAGAVVAAKQVGGATGEGLLIAARDAFASSLNLVAGLSALLVIAVSVAVLRVSTAKDA